MRSDSIKTKLNNLDLLRFFAAICIVLFHYNKFTGTLHSDANFPLFNIFKYAYIYGGNLVELFFLISGFTFFCIYAEKIRQAKVSGKEFFKRRVARLLPLYWFTTLGILVCRFACVKLYHEKMFGGGQIILLF